MSDKMKRLHVKGTGEVDHKTILWEKHPEHPKGEIYVVNDGKTYEVAKTKSISNLLTQGRLEETEKSEPAAKKAAPKEGSGKEPPKGSPPPWDGYDALPVDEITSRLRDLTPEERASVLAYEQATKKRAGIITPLVNWNS